MIGSTICDQIEANFSEPLCRLCHTFHWWQSMYSIKYNTEINPTQPLLLLKQTIIDNNITDYHVAKQLIKQTAHCIPCVRNLLKIRQHKFDKQYSDLKHSITTKS